MRLLNLVCFVAAIVSNIVARPRLLDVLFGRLVRGVLSVVDAIMDNESFDARLKHLLRFGHPPPRDMSTGSPRRVEERTDSAFSQPPTLCFWTLSMALKLLIVCVLRYRSSS